MIPAGTYTASVSGSVSGLTAAVTNDGELRDIASSELVKAGLRIIDLQTNSAGGDFFGTWTYSGSVKVVTPTAYRSIEDLRSIIQHAFWKAAGSPPGRVLLAAESGAPAPVTPPTPGSGGFPNFNFDKLNISLGLVAAIVVGAVVLKLE